ncbi:hypothetical protein B0H63DRAFT_488306 [Podospora didyma]|uniref:CFEM domain-containing protein n=1 Tax=Podospora didyma TaxID=330526 RepID=A0AAE0K2E3_9PEZI|nr:hypothetical protein B0H63DRAFT_488306 [Podospora didyma]
MFMRDGGSFLSRKQSKMSLPKFSAPTRPVISPLYLFWSLFAFLALVIAQAPSLPSSSAIAVVGSLPVCAQTCITAAFSFCHCPLADFDCFCTCPNVAAFATTCTSQRCSADALSQAARDALDVICPKPSSSSSSLSSFSTTIVSWTLTTSITTTTPPIPSTTTRPCFNSTYGNGTMKANATNATCPGSVVVAGVGALEMSWNMVWTSSLLVVGLVSLLSV